MRTVFYNRNRKLKKNNNMQKDIFHLETYREHEIWYNADTDKFTVELLVDNDWREKGRKSLNDCRKAIDDHIKANFEFKPIKALRNTWHGSKQLITIKQVRSDGGFVIRINGDTKDRTEISEVIDQISGKQITFFNYSPDYVEYLDKEAKMLERHEQEILELKKTEPQLTTLDLSFVKQIAKI